MSHTTLQVLGSAIRDGAVVALMDGEGPKAKRVMSDDGKGLWVVAKAISAIVPGEVDRRERLRNFSGDLDEYAELVRPRYQAYGLPVGTVLIPSVGTKGESATGGTAFFGVPDSVIAENDLGEGTSQDIQKALELWVASQPTV